MRMDLRAMWLAVVAGLSSLVLPAACARPLHTHFGEATVVPLALRYATEWKRLTPWGTGRLPEGETRSALLIDAALRPGTDDPYPVDLGVDPAQLRRSFRLPQRELLVGEPLLVELRIELDGPGIWYEAVGGNYRMKGRDDNFVFLLRREDGTWVADPYDVNVMGDGIMSSYEVRSGAPRSYWFPVQKWAVIDRPGTYELYCVKRRMLFVAPLGATQALQDALPDEVRRVARVEPFATLIDLETGDASTRYQLAPQWQPVSDPPSPLTDALPGAVAERILGMAHVTDVAWFRIVVRAPTGDEQARMVARWTAIASAPSSGPSYPTGEARAAGTAIWFSPDDAFLPTLRSWLEDRSSDSEPLPVSGLARRPSREALSLFLALDPGESARALRALAPGHVPAVIPVAIEWLTHPESEVRARAEQALRDWTGQSFAHSWEGYDYERPTLKEGRRMQPAWREWWQANRHSFQPPSR